MIREQDKLRAGPKIYHDLIFEEEIKNLINTTKEHYDASVSSPRPYANEYPNIFYL